MERPGLALGGTALYEGWKSLSLKEQGVYSRLSSVSLPFQLVWVASRSSVLLAPPPRFSGEDPRSQGLGTTLAHQRAMAAK